MADNRNFILAIVLSLAVMLGWQFFIAGPQLEQQRIAQQAALQQQQAQQQTPPAAGAAPGQPGAAAQAPGTAPGTAPAGSIAAPESLSRSDALAASPRIPIRSEGLTGTLNLRGARIDDVALNRYRVTVDPASESVTLLSPEGAKDAYFAEVGYTVPAGAATPMPTANTVWSAPEGATLTTETPVTLTWDNAQGLVFRRTISVDADYMFTIEDTIENTGAGDTVLYPYGFVQRHSQPPNSGNYILHEGLVGVLGDGKLSEVHYNDLKDDGEVKPGATATGWLGITDKYWASALVPDAARGFQPRFLHSRVANTDTYQADYLGDSLTVAAGSSATTTTRLFAGAKEVGLLDAYASSYAIPQFDLLIDWGWFYFLTKPMFYLIDMLFNLVGNFGVAILLVTVLIKGIFYPLANKSYVSMSKMKKVQPQMAEIKERHKDDRVKQQQALMELYKTEKINPLAGCLPILVQIPVFFALYKVLFVTIEMRHAPFFGWIQDLSAPDPTTIFNLFGLIPWDPSVVPVLGPFLMLGIWPLIMGITMFFQMKLNPTPPDPTQAMIFNWMPVIFTFMLASFPAGLVIYWAWNNTLSVLQQSVIMKRQGVKIELYDNIRNLFRRGTAKS
ncbi:membrane protein insertase YidC [Methylobrevis albus]|uniref:Membrane protein insertase YidC n=1 Tax=Methylobrevis albus TaxID=2793297 RepID=A0A931HZ99_9HYPH|nr:membrane protein insertase YidC [Methylobrevis albus]MBH0236403.1 membrane protein insertase YidC [Methylobrevis albus]